MTLLLSYTLWWSSACGWASSRATLPLLILSMLFSRSFLYVIVELYCHWSCARDFLVSFNRPNSWMNGWWKIQKNENRKEKSQEKYNGISFPSSSFAFFAYSTLSSYNYAINICSDGDDDAGDTQMNTVCIRSSLVIFIVDDVYSSFGIQVCWWKEKEMYWMCHRTQWPSYVSLNYTTTTITTAAAAPAAASAAALTAYFFCSLYGITRSRH